MAAAGILCIQPGQEHLEDLQRTDRPIRQRLLYRIRPGKGKVLRERLHPACGGGPEYDRKGFCETGRSFCVEQDEAQPGPDRQRSIADSQKGGVFTGKRSAKKKIY